MDNSMLSQQKAEDDLLKVYGRMVAVLVLLVLVTVLGVSYIKTAPSISSRGLSFEHNRLLNVLAMIRSQWLATGRPKKMLLSWHDMAENGPNNYSSEDVSNNELSPIEATVDAEEAALVGTNNWINLSAKGWPLIDTYDADGCKRLWQQLLATSVKDLDITVEYQSKEKVCRYASRDQASLSFQLQTGRVIFLMGR